MLMKKVLSSFKKVTSVGVLLGVWWDRFSPTPKICVSLNTEAQIVSTSIHIFVTTGIRHNNDV